MGEKMQFPATVEEFMQQYKIIDTEQIYSNGMELVPIHRMRQWFDHIADAQPATWIPVTERLPEETGSYLVWMRWPHDESHVHSIINFDADCEAFGEWEEYYDPVSLGWAGSDFIEIENVYAWMPLPEPPEGGADG